MHLYSDEKIKTMDQEELQQHLSITSDAVEEMKELLATKQRTRTLVLWHDHATLLGRIHTLYDNMVFLSHNKHLYLIQEKGNSYLSHRKTAFRRY